MKRKVACYARVNADQQTSGLEAQVRALKEYCDKKGITDYEIFSDEDFSGTKAARPALDRMMTAVENAEIATVIVYSFSRFARSITHLLTALEKFQRVNTEFISITEKIETGSPMDRTFFNAITAISHLERELIVERAKNGLRNAREKGIPIGRQKTRPSEVIRKLLEAKMTYRQIAAVCKISHGSVHAEIIAMRKEKEAA